jgi:hypothetical protein
LLSNRDSKSRIPAYLYGLARRVLKSNTAALMLAQRAPGETAFGWVHQPTSQPQDDRHDGGGLEGVLHEVAVKASP